MLSEMLSEMLRTLGESDEDLRRTVPELALSYRDVTASKRLLVILDDPIDPATAAMLLPSGTGSVLLVTTRSWSTDSSIPASRVDLDILPRDTACTCSGTFSAPTGSMRSPKQHCAWSPCAISYRSCWGSAPGTSRRPSHRSPLSSVRWSKPAVPTRRSSKRPTGI
jgi:hypothetical protein